MDEPNIYQSVIDQANERRLYLAERGHQTSPELAEKVKQYLREREARRVMRLLGRNQSAR